MVLAVKLRHVNRYLIVQKFKDEDLRVAMLMFKPGEWMFSLPKIRVPSC